MSGAALRALVVAALVVAPGCKLSIELSLEPPPDSWDPARNTHPAGAELQALLDRYVADGLPGAVLLVRTPEGMWNGAAGYAEIESASPMQPSHRHHAASVTKLYLAVATLSLAEDGGIDLDAEIRDYLPEEIWRRVPNGDRATVRQLLGHTSGIPNFGDSMAYDLDTLNDPMGWFPPERLLSYVEGQSPLFAPGEGYFYSNTNYLLLGMVVDRAAARDHAAVIRERVLEPLGLSATYYKEQPGYPTPPGLVASYEDLAGDGRLMNVTDLVIHNAEMFSGHVGLIATSADYAEFLDGLFAGRVIGDAALVALQERTRCDCYGLGLSFVDTPYGPALGHSGGDLGVTTRVRWFPEVDATVVLLINGGDGGITGDRGRGLWDAATAAALARLPGTRRAASTPGDRAAASGH